MNDAVDCAPLARGVRIGAWQIVGVAERGPYVCRYLAEDARRRVVLQELLPQAFVRRDGHAVQARDAEDRTTLRWWLRNYLDKTAALAPLAQAGLARVLDGFEANGTGYAVLEHIPGETLAERVRARGALDWRDYLAALRPVVNGLAEAHAQNLVWRDISPAQIVLRADGRAALSAFGPLRAPVRFRAQTLISTTAPAYAAPEELAAAGTIGAIGPWTDAYALAASSAYALFGRVPPDAAQRAQAPLAFAFGDPLPAATRAVLEAALGAPAESRPGLA
ncbi:MAG: protein kinase domain-containing protein, partial [Solimonas sp.]